METPTCWNQLLLSCLAKDMCCCDSSHDEESLKPFADAYFYEENSAVRESVLLGRLRRWLRCVNAWSCLVHGCHALIPLILQVALHRLVTPVCISHWVRSLGRDNTECAVIYMSQSVWYIFAVLSLSCIHHYWTWIRMFLPRVVRPFTATIAGAEIEAVGASELLNYWDGLDLFQNPYRWMEYQFSISLMAEFIVQMLGAASAEYQMAIFAISFVVFGFSFLMERTNSERMVRNVRAQSSRTNSNVTWRGLDWAPVVFVWAGGILVWCCMIPATIYDTRKWVLAIYVTSGLLWLGVYSVAFYVYRMPSTSDLKAGVTSRVYYYRGELVYQILSLIIKTAFTWQTIGGIAVSRLKNKKKQRSN